MLPGMVFIKLHISNLNRVGFNFNTNGATNTNSRILHTQANSKPDFQLAIIAIGITQNQ